MGFLLTGGRRPRPVPQQEAPSIRGTLSPRSFQDARARFKPAIGVAPFAHHVRVRRKHRPYTHGLLLVIISAAVVYGVFTNGGFPGRSQAFAAPVTGLSLPGVGSSVPATSQTILRPQVSNRTLSEPAAISKQQQDAKDNLAGLEAISAPTATATAGASQEDPALRAASVNPPPELPPYQVYRVVEGDTLSGIAGRFGIDPQYIVANNAEILNSDSLALGQSILVPAGNGILHEVRLDENLGEIAGRYGVSVDAIIGFAPNGIASADAIVENALIFVPGATLPTASAPDAAPLPGSGGPTEEATPEPDTSSDSADSGDSSDSGNGDGTGADGEIVGGGPSSSEGLIWPISGPISSYYGPSHPLGIDIDGFNLVGSAIGAATSGTVVFAGGNACCSYGLYVVIVSPGGVETLYGHLSSIYVSQGETVSQGQAIGVIGNTGYSTGTHLHFEVIDNGSRVNPLSYLP